MPGMLFRPMKDSKSKVDNLNEDCKKDTDLIKNYNYTTLCLCCISTLVVVYDVIN